MSHPFLRHHDAAQIRMALEADAEEIEDFALVIVGAGPDRGDGFNGGIFFPDPGLQPDALLILVRNDVVAELEAWVRGKPVDGGHVFEGIVARLFYGTGGLADGF